MLNREFTMPKSNPQKRKFIDLPLAIQEDMLKTAQHQYEFQLRELKGLIASNRQKEEYLIEKLEESVKHLACKHDVVEHDKSSGITDNTILCKECGFGWSDY